MARRNRDSGRFAYKASCRPAKRSSGQSLVELALAMPVIIVIFVGIVDFSRLYNAYVAATNAARAGAEVAMDVRISDGAIVSAVRNEASPAVSLSSVTVAPSPRSAGSPVQVGVTYVFNPYTPLVSSFWGGGALPLVVTATARAY